MSRNRTLGSAIFILLGLGAAFAWLVLPAPARAQYGYQCPPGYYYDSNYGCVPPGYFYGPPYYAYPDLGFDFFYGGGWGQRWGGNYGPRGGVPRGGVPRGGVPHGGGVPPGRGAAHGGGGHDVGHGGR